MDCSITSSKPLPYANFQRDLGSRSLESLEITTFFSLCFVLQLYTILTRTSIKYQRIAKMYITNSPILVHTMTMRQIVGKRLLPQHVSPPLLSQKASNHIPIEEYGDQVRQRYINNSSPTQITCTPRANSPKMDTKEKNQEREAQSPIRFPTKETNNNVQYKPVAKRAKNPCNATENLFKRYQVRYPIETNWKKPIEI